MTTQLLFYHQNVADFTEKIANEKGFRFSAIHLEEHLNSNVSVDADLLLLEYVEEMRECGWLLKKIIRESKKTLSIIIIAKHIDFTMKKMFYNLEISAIVQLDQLFDGLLEKYMDAMKRQQEILYKLRTTQIAVVDDSKFSVELIRSFFEKMEVHQVDYYHSSEILLTKLNDYDLFYIDLVMPDYSGDEIICKIRECNQNAIIIVITTYGDGTSLPYCLSVGADDFLLKPFDSKMFFLRTSAAISHKELNLQNERNAFSLYDMATKDALTGLYNRRYFIELFKSKLAEASRSQQIFSVILLDLDHFKNVNDEFGHLRGDEVLKSVAELLMKHTRNEDCASRWGGEEFCVLLNQASLDMATLVAEKLRKLIEEMEIPVVGKVTASFGVTQWINMDTEDLLFKRMDNSLYLAKLTGRNKVVSNEELYIDKGGFPVNIEWGPFFRSGNEQIDREHSELISLSNEIILYCFQKDNQSHLIKLFDQLLDHIVEHFKNEEVILENYGYEDLENHKKIHSDLVEKSTGMREKLWNGQVSKTDLSKYLIQEVVVGHIIKHDFEFYHHFK